MQQRRILIQNCGSHVKWKSDKRFIPKVIYYIVYYMYIYSYSKATLNINISYDQEMLALGTTLIAEGIHYKRQKFFI